MTVIDPAAIPHRVRAMTVEIGRVLRCPTCHATTFEGFRFDPRRDPLPGNRMLINPDSAEDVSALLDALLDMSTLVERECLPCAAGIND